MARRSIKKAAGDEAVQIGGADLNLVNPEPSTTPVTPAGSALST